jgi:HEPN superfamily RiboL-PSP-like protein
VRPIANFDELQNALTDDLTWRLREIAAMQSVIQRSSITERRTLLRAALVLLYAHWEGYVKVASLNYLRFVAGRRRRYKQLSSNFVYLANYTVLRRLEGQRRSVRDKIRIVEEIVASVEGVNKDMHANRVDTQSNLSTDTMREICATIGLSSHVFDAEEALIDKLLLARRNHIAHGEDVSITPEELHDLSTKVLDLMRQFRTQVENSAISEEYLKAPKSAA